MIIAVFSIYIEEEKVVFSDVELAHSETVHHKNVPEIIPGVAVVAVPKPRVTGVTHCRCGGYGRCYLRSDLLPRTKCVICYPLESFS